MEGKKKLKSRFYSSFKNKSCLSSFPLPLRSDRERQDAVLAPLSPSHTACCLGERVPSRGARAAGGGTPRAAPFSPRLATGLPSGHSRRPSSPQIRRRRRLGRRGAWDLPEGNSVIKTPLWVVTGDPAPRLLAAPRTRRGSRSAAREEPLCERYLSAAPARRHHHPRHRQRGRGGQELPPIRSCSWPLTDKPRHPIGAVTRAGGATVKGALLSPPIGRSRGAGHRPGAWLGGQGARLLGG